VNSWELEARELVRQTLSDYTAATDRFDLETLAACFADDGTLEFPDVPALVGPIAIEAGLRAQITGGSSALPKPTRVRHHVSSLRFVACSSDRVETTSSFAVFTDVGVDHWGRYRDLLIPISERWLFSSRKISVDGFSPESLMRR
jgi:hypothetical protein